MTAKKKISLEELAKHIGGELIGDRNLTVSNICDIEEAQKGDLVFVFRKKSKNHLLEKTKASASVVPDGIEKSPIPIIKCRNPNLAFKKAAELILPQHIPHPKGINTTASIGENVKLGKDVTVGAYACLEGDAEIGDGTVIYAHCYIGCSTKIGSDCVIYPNVTVRENVKIGDRVIIHPGCVIGGDGFGYEQTQRGHEKIPHIGNVIIEDDVELGACVTVDRAKIAHTKIQRGTKIDNLVQIAHNVTIGKNCIIVAQTGISGSVKIGNNVMIGGQVGFVDHVEIGDNAMIAAQSGVMKSVPPNTIMFGTPARPIKKTKKLWVLWDRLPEIYERLKALEKKLGIK
ncbi:MAG: UDP-3-O-(3-hydroxymyristoyl)glucosamine N-acyltransferase [Candidatus Omnitrophota bacterium]